MKVSSQSTQRTRIKASISTTEILAFVRQTMAIPDRATVVLSAADDMSTVFLTEDWPLKLEATWEDSHGAAPEREIGMLAVAPVVTREDSAG